MHLRGTGESFAANIGGRLIGTSFAWVTATLAVTPDRAYAPTKVALVAAAVGFSVYLVGFIAQLLAARTESRLTGVGRMTRTMRDARRGAGPRRHRHSCGPRRRPSPPPDLQGKLYRSVFSSGSGVLAPADVKALPEPVRGRLEKYLARRGAFKSNYKSEAGQLRTRPVDAKRRLVEQAIVSLIDSAGIERIAADYVSTAPIRYEWEGMPDGPLEEANHAEALLTKDPASPLAPWFYVFIAQRQRSPSKPAKSRRTRRA